MTAAQVPAAALRMFAPGVVLILWRRELLRFARDRSQIFGSVSRTVLWLLIFGYGLGGALRDIEGYTYSQYILGGVMVLNVLFASMHTAMALVGDRDKGLLRQVLVSPAPVFSVVLGKLLGGATTGVLQGSIPLLFAPFIGVTVHPSALLSAWAIMFAMGVTLTALGVIIASRMHTMQSFGSISNSIIMPLYFLSGAIYPLKGVVGGVGFLDLPDALRDELRRLGVHAVGGGWVVQLPEWLMLLVYANPVSYGLDLLRLVLLGFNQLPLAVDVAMLIALPVLLAGLASFAVSRMECR